MNVFMIYVRDENYYQMLPKRLDRSQSSNGRIKVMAFPPLGIETLAPVLRQHGHRVRMFDTCHPKMKIEHIIHAVESELPDCLMLSFISTTTYPATKSMAKELKKKAPQIPIIVGGTFASFNATHIIEDCPYIDCVGVGEGEELLVDYMDHLSDPGSVTGLVWRRGEEVVENEPRQIIKDLDQFPSPDRTSLPIDYIESLPLDVPTILSMDKFCTMQTSRGCPYKCVYCDIPSLADGKWRFRSPEHVLGEMQQLNVLGYRSIYLTDDHFLLKRKRINEICNGMIERKFQFSWGCEGRVDSIAVDQFPIMGKSRCAFLAFGVESGTQKILDRLKKDQTLEEIEHAVNASKRHGITRAHGFFLIGSPGETEKDIMASFRFAAKLKLDTFGFNRLCVYRGTPLWQEYINRGIIDDNRDWYKWFKCSDIDPTVLPSEVVNRVRMKGFTLLFSRRFLFRPIKTFKLLRTFARYMKLSDLLKLLSGPFRRRVLTHEPNLTAKMIELGLKEPLRESEVEAWQYSFKRKA